MESDNVMKTYFRAHSFLAAVVLALFASIALADGRKPNFIIVLVDDLGYADIEPFGSKANRTPNLTRLAAEGMCFTDFYVSAGVCSPSRASLMTGCYPLRVDLHESSRGVFVLCPMDQKGINPSEITLAETLKSKGYATACIGKWHLGDQDVFFPTRHGFDFHYGIPYSNDGGRKPKTPPGDRTPPLPLMRNETVIEAPAKQETLTKRYTQEAVNFIRRHKDSPFFLYLPHTAVHTPLRGGDEFFGESANGLYGDGVEEVDWSTGELLNTVRELGLERDTIVIFTSDNGATSAGSNAPFAGGKAQILEGGMRVPCIMWGPGRIPAGTKCDKVATAMDFLPTFARMAGTQEPQDRKIDGRDIGSLMRGEPGAESPHEAFYYYFMSQLQAVRSGKWKLHLALDPKLVTWTGRPTGTAKAQLYDLSADPGELTNVIAEHPDVVRRLTELADRARKDIGDYQVKGAGARPTIRVAEPKPLSVPESARLPFPEPPSERTERVSAVFPGKRPQRRE